MIVCSTIDWWMFLLLQVQDVLLAGEMLILLVRELLVLLAGKLLELLARELLVPLVGVLVVDLPMLEKLIMWSPPSHD